MITNHNYFEILGLKTQFTQDMNVVNDKLTQLQASVHPDNFATATMQEKRLMMQYSAMLNEAFTTIKDPIKRACHLLELAGIRVDAESTLALDDGFLEEQMDLRESLHTYKNDIASLQSLQQKIEMKVQKILENLALLLDSTDLKNLLPAREKVIQVQFYQKFLEEIRKIPNSVFTA